MSTARAMSCSSARIARLPSWLGRITPARKLRINVLGTQDPAGVPSLGEHRRRGDPRPELGAVLAAFPGSQQDGHGQSRGGVPYRPEAQHCREGLRAPRTSRGTGAFSTSSSDANVFFTRVSEDELLLLSSASDEVLSRWPLKDLESGGNVLHAVSEVIKKAGSEESYAVRSAVVTESDDWLLIRNGDLAWTRPEGLEWRCRRCLCGDSRKRRVRQDS